MSQDYRKVFILDQDIKHANRLSKLLTQQGCQQVVRFDSGVKVLSAIAQGDSPDLLVTELVTSDIDVFTLLHDLSSSSFEGQVLLVSGQDERVLGTANEVAVSLGCPVLGSLRKPLIVNELQWILREHKKPLAIKTSRSMDSLSCYDLKRGLRSGALLPYYQPKWDTARRRIIGFEALARWRGESGLIQSPATFIPTAEKHGFIDEFTHRFLRVVLADVQRLQAVDPKQTMAINFSIDTLENRELPDVLEKMAQILGIALDTIVVEVTESRLSHERINLLEVLARLHLKGFKLSIDDFGTGYSSLYRVKDIPFSELKIDQSFVQGALADSSARAVIRSSLQLAEDLGMSVIAEGVEAKENQVLIEEMGCSLMQGFLFAKPQAFESVQEMLVAQVADEATKQQRLSIL